MAAVQDNHILANKPSSSFSSISSAASATSAGTHRSGGSKLLFGEIDTSSDRSSENYASVCSLVLSDSSTFLRFWLTDECRDNLISVLPQSDLANLRLVCHDFSVRTAPALFSDLSITFKTNTFKPSRIAALHRCGYHVKHLKFNTPHNANTFLPPLIHPETGDELSFTYTPQITPPSAQQPKYGDWDTTEILTKQYPPLFHAATNVDSFIQAISAFVNLEHLEISCPGYNLASRFRRSTLDFILISLRIAVERNCLNALDTLTLAPLHPGGLLYLSPLIGYGATPSSIRRWSKIKTLTIECAALPKGSNVKGEPDQIRLLQTYLHNYRRNLQSFSFRWLDNKGPFPFSLAPPASSRLQNTAQHPALADQRPATAPSLSTAKPQTRNTIAHFVKLKNLDLENATSTAGEIAAMVTQHKHTLEDLNFKDITLTRGTWEQAFAPLTRMAAKTRMHETADIPIMLSPDTDACPKPMHRVEVVQQTVNGRRSIRASRWLPRSSPKHPSTPRTPRTPLLTSPAAGAATNKIKHSLMHHESPFKKALRSAGFPWLRPLIYADE